jgi:glycosyltransferase involved in cell wall biosynthesis
MKTALVHDWLTGMRGGEKALELLAELLPDSDLYTLIHVPGSVSEIVEGRRLVTSWLNRLPGVGRYYRWLLPLMPHAAGRMKLEGYDLVVAVSHCVAHGVEVCGGRFVTWCLTPMRYIWDTAEAYFPGRRRRDPRYAVLKRLAPLFRGWDRRAAARVDEYLAISRVVAGRVQRCYGRDAEVVYPPVETGFYRPTGEAREEFYLWAGALAPYKRFDLTLTAFARNRRRLVVIGEGQDLGWARRRAPENVTFLGRTDDETLRSHYSRARALVFPGEEDFGIVPVEAQACGTPVIAYGGGGVSETVVPLGASGAAPTGVFFDEQTPEALLDAVARFEAADDFDRDAIRANALRFSRERCIAALRPHLHDVDGERPA